MWCLIRVSTVCLQNVLFKFLKKMNNTTPQPLKRNGLVQLIIEENSIWLKMVNKIKRKTLFWY